MEEEIEFDTNETAIMFYTTVVNIIFAAIGYIGYDLYLTYL
tara:strand:+ start:702 stop:824 length:123 start_codon:yes stop_codon:yes gene_type:complete